MSVFLNLYNKKFVSTINKKIKKTTLKTSTRSFALNKNEDIIKKKEK